MAARWREVASLVVFLGIFCASGCAVIPPSGPMRSIEAQDRNSDTLVVMLPGIHDTAETFLTAGFVDAAASGAFDVLAADARWRYYSSGSVVKHLHDDVVEPARQRGYRSIWLLGVSLGGYGSLLYVDAFPDEVTGIILLSPYLGARHLSDRIKNAGGLEAWTSDSERLERFERGWVSLKKLCAVGATNVILGYGTSDPLSLRDGPLLDALQPSQVYIESGGHDWTTWTPLWSQIRESVQIH